MSSGRRARAYSPASGIGAGAGAALVMILAMAGLRFGLGVPSIPELMLGPLLRLMGGQNFSNALDTLYYAGRPLVFTIILEGTLALGALLGLVYAWLAKPNRITGHRFPVFYSPTGGVLYGLLIGLLLNTAFLPILGEPAFSERAHEVYSNSFMPLWAGLFLLALLYGLVLHLLLPPVSAPLGLAGAALAEIGNSDRRRFLRIAAGGGLALLGGLGVFGGGTFLNQGGSFSSPVQRKAVEDAGNPSDPGQPDVAQAAESTPQALPTATSTTAPADTPNPPTATPTSQPTATSMATTQPATSTPGPSSTPQPPTSTPTATPTATSTPTATPTSTSTSTATSTPVPAPVIKVQEVTPTGSFYHVSKNFFDPTPSSDGWSLSVFGLAGNPYAITYKELTTMPAIDVVTGMTCISNPVGGGLIGNARWKGVRLADLVRKAKPQQGVTKVRLSALDGYGDSIAYQKALDPNVMLVWEMNGAPLTSEHGFPARLLVPGIYGMKHVKWITGVELINYDFRGYWQQPDQGWSDPAPVNTMSRIDFPAQGTLDRSRHTIAGIAFAGDRSISKVEVSTDGGKSWNAAYVKPPMSGTSWVVWGYDWTPPGPGKYTVIVRATDGRGFPQSSRRTDPYPNGATGYHTVVYTVR